MVVVRIAVGDGVRNLKGKGKGHDDGLGELAVCVCVSQRSFFWITLFVYLFPWGVMRHSPDLFQPNNGRESLIS